MKYSAAVIGLGYVGLPLAVLLKKKKVKIFGFDSNIEVVKKIKSGKSYISDLSNKEVSLIKNENIYSLKDINLISKVDFIIIFENRAPAARYSAKKFGTRLHQCTSLIVVSYYVVWPMVRPYLHSQVRVTCT